MRAFDPQLVVPPACRVCVLCTHHVGGLLSQCRLYRQGLDRCEFPCCDRPNTLAPPGGGWATLQRVAVVEGPNSHNY